MELFATISNKTSEAEQEAYYKSDEFAVAVENMFGLYSRLSPMQRFSFLTMLNPTYSPMVTVWNDTDGAYNNFVFLVYKHYRNLLRYFSLFSHEMQIF